MSDAQVDAEIARRFYPSMSHGPQEPAKAAVATPAAPAAPPPVEAREAGQAVEVEAATKPSTESREPPALEELTMEQRMYGDAVSTNSNVEWEEDAAPGAAHYDLAELPVDLRHPDPDVYAAGQAQFREGLLAAGAGPSLARELWGDAIRAERNPIRTTASEASAQLRNRWGPKTDAKVAAARDLIGKAIAKCPEIKTALERTGLGNDVNFIVKLSKRADALSKKAAK